MTSHHDDKGLFSIYIDDQLKIAIYFLEEPPKDLKNALIQEIQFLCHEQKFWVWNTWEIIFHKINQWLIIYNKAKNRPVYVGIAAIKKNFDSHFMAYTDLFYSLRLLNGDITVTGQQLYYSQSTSILERREILIPRNILGAFHEIKGIICDEFKEGAVILVPRQNKVTFLKEKVMECGYDLECLQQKLEDNFVYLMAG